MEPELNRRVPKVPDPIEYDPFEMDWPWPGMLPEPEPPVERSVGELTSEQQSEVPASDQRDA